MRKRSSILFIKVLAWIELMVFLGKEITVAAFQVAGYAIFKGPKVRPALVRMKLRVQSQLGVFLLSSFVTLTPGTVSVDEEDGELLIHVIHTDEKDFAKNVTDRIRRGFEERIMSVLGEKE